MILYLAIVTLILSIVQAVYNYKINRNSLYLGGYLIITSILGILHILCLYPGKSAVYLAILYGHFMPIFYLAPPLLFFYTRGTLNDNSKISKWDIIHFFPAIIGLISIFPYYFETFKYKIDIANQIIDNVNVHKRINISWLYNNAFNLPARTILLFIYSVGSILMVIQYSLKNNYVTLSKTKKITLRWLYVILFISIAGSVNYMILNYIFFSNSNITNKTISSYDVNFYVGITFSLVPILLIISPKVLYGFPSYTEVVIPFNEVLPATSKSNLEEIEEIYFQNLSKKVIEYLNEEKPYLNPDFSLDFLADKLDIQKYHLQYCFNSVLETKFTTIRNQMRVEYAKECLLNGDLNKVSMNGIWSKAGFSSKTNFFATFKEITQMTPVNFINTHHLKSGFNGCKFEN